MAWFDSVSGHLWTMAPAVQARLRPAQVPAGEPFEVSIPDADVGVVRVTGVLRRVGQKSPLLVIVHGLGGSIASPYMIRLARLAEAAQASTLLLNLRGANRSGDDIYHAGLITDLVSALQSPVLAEFQQIALLGCSMGGHMALRFCLAPSDARVRAVGALCSPVDLEQGCADIDVPARSLYREHVLTGLKQMYAQAHARMRVKTPLEAVQAVQTLRGWDELAVVPRFGFPSVEAYWQATQVAPHLRGLALPTRIVIAKSDPMVLASTSQRHMTNLPKHVQVQAVSGGHLGFPPMSRTERELVEWLVKTAQA